LAQSGITRRDCAKLAPLSLGAAGGVDRLPAVRGTHAEIGPVNGTRIDWANLWRWPVVATRWDYRGSCTDAQRSSLAQSGITPATVNTRPSPVHWCAAQVVQCWRRHRDWEPQAPHEWRCRRTFGGFLTV